MRVVIDDAADLPEELAEKHHVASIPVNINFGTEQFLSRIDMTQKEFYEKVKTVTDENFPKTSQPTPYQFVEFFRKLMAQTGETEFLTITVGHKLSGTYASAIAAAKELEGEATIHVFDSMGASAVQGYMGLEAARMLEKGASLEEIWQRLEYMRDNQVTALVIKSLEFAVRGGRISALRSTLASLLNIKPIMQLKDGEVIEAGKVRTHKKAVQFMIDFVKERVGDKPVKLAVLHAGDEQGGQALWEQVKDQFNMTEHFIVDLCVPVAINIGPGALGIIAIPE